MTRLRLGTRGSPLAKAQSRWVAERLERLHPGIGVETVVIKTSGDLSLPVPNVKTAFVKELEEALLRGDIDIAVHSAKDLPEKSAEGLCILAYPEREDPRDAFVGAEACRTWAALPRGSVLGTSALRRKVQLLRIRPDLRIEPLRGNVDTRLRKLAQGAFSGLVLAAAGLKRLGLQVPSESFPTDVLVPAPGQGALAVQACSERAELGALLSALDDPDTRLEVELERRFAAAVGGGCSTPLGAFARCEGEGVRLTVFFSDLLTDRAGKSAEELSSLVERLRRRIL
ncbi:MAG: hydroxymethylbilane synthase [Elusimicrobiota bacterium]